MKVSAMLEPIPEAFWSELQPLLRTFEIALPPA